MARRDRDLSPVVAPFRPGDRVRTAPTLAPRDFTDETRATRVPGMLGVVQGCSRGHGLCYEIVHLDGTRSYYDPDELVFLGATSSGVIGDSS